MRGRGSRRPDEGFIDDDCLGHAARVVAPVEREVLAGAAGAIAEMRIAPDQPAGQPLGVRVEQQFVGVEPVTLLGIIRPVHAIAVELARRHVGEVSVPDILGPFGQRHAVDLAAALTVEKAKLDLLRVRREQCEVCSAAIPCRPERGR